MNNLNYNIRLFLIIYNLKKLSKFGLGIKIKEGELKVIEN